MLLYIDASVLVSLFADDALTSRADRALRQRSDIVVVSDFAAAEFASAMARLVRTREMARGKARDAFAAFDSWTDRHARREEIQPSDIAFAEHLLRRLDVTLRTPDALHLALARRLAAMLVTFDRNLARNARRLKIGMLEA